MRKVIISILIVILIVIAYLLLFGNFQVGNISIKNINDIKALNEQLEQEIVAVNQKISQEYANQLKQLKTAIDDLKIQKEQYEKYNVQGEEGIVQIDTYKIEYLWAIIGQYAKNRNVVLTFNLLEGEAGLYNLNFELIGDYTDIINFLSDIENDDSFNFKIANFNLGPYTKTITKIQTESIYETSTQVIPQNVPNKTPEQTIITEMELPYDNVETVTEVEDETVASSYNPKRLMATFQIYNVGIELN